MKNGKLETNERLVVIQRDYKLTDAEKPPAYVYRSTFSPNYGWRNYKLIKIFDGRDYLNTRDAEEWIKTVEKIK